MSVLSFPRIYFKGFMEWDPCTFNNNDWQKFPTYDGINAALNWDFLAGEGITPQNFQTTFRPWAIKLQTDDEDSPRGPRVPCEWNMFGSHSVAFVQHGSAQTTVITGGALAYNQPVTSDPLIGGPVSIGGNQGAALVDNNPFSFWSSQIYFGGMSFGTAACGFGGPRNLRMHSRWLNLARIYSSAQSLTAPAAGVGACFQTTIPFDQVTWPADGASPLVAALKQAASQPGALGIMARFTAYVNLYFKNGVFNDTKQRPRNYPELADALAQAWNAWTSSGGQDTSLFFSQPCYSHVIGTVGVWNDHELVSIPGGRYLVAQSAVAPNVPAATPNVRLGHAAPQASAAPPPPTTLGPVAVQVDDAAQIISLDFGSAMPENGTPGEWPSDLTKADFGALTVGVVANNAFTAVASIDYARYARAAYEAAGGIIDIPFPNAGTGALLAGGSLAVQAQGQTALLEAPLTAQTDSRGIYLNQKEQSEFQVQICAKGVPAPGASVLVARYDEGLNLIPSDQPSMVNFTNGAQQNVTVPNGTSSITTGVTVLTADGYGNATVGISAQSPNFAVLAFYPYTGTTLPQPATSLFPSGPPLNNFVGFAFYTSVRVLPFDDAVPQQFVDLWNSSQDQNAAWNFIYGQILYVYDMLFSVMLEFINLGSRSAVEQSIGAIWTRVSAAMAAENPGAMPITRDLSAGKRLTLQLWIFLVANKYNVPNFSVSSIPAGWKPPS